MRSLAAVLHAPELDILGLTGDDFTSFSVVGLMN